MGEIFVDGLGTVQIEGAIPNAAEREAIKKQLRAGTVPEPPRPQQQPAELPPPTGETRTGVVPEEAVAGVRQFVRDQPGLAEFGIEMAPATIGTAIGGVAGAPLGPPGIFAGGTVGGLLGEFLGQETGVTPQSDVALGLAAGGPAIGRAAGGALRLGRRAGGKMAGAFPPAKAALARSTEQAAVQEFESLGSRILSKQKGLMAKGRDELFDQARALDAVVDLSDLPKTTSAIGELSEELSQLGRFPEAVQAQGVVDDVLETLTRNEDISFNSLITARQLLGAAVRRAESQGGLKLGKAKKLFQSLSDDIDEIAAKEGVQGEAASLARTATKRAKLEFAVRDVEGAVARFTKDVPGESAVEINIPGLQKWFRDVTNPKSANFDKNLTEALGDQLPAIKSRLKELSEVVGSGSAAGPGSIVVRGRGAQIGSAIFGGMAGFGMAGEVGAGAGALLGAGIPEMLTGALMTKPGHAILKRAVKLGRGQISQSRWNVIGQIVAQAARPSEQKQ